MRIKYGTTNLQSLPTDLGLPRRKYLCSDECRTEWEDVLRRRAYTTIVTPHRTRYDQVCRDVDADKATQEEKEAAKQNLDRARELHAEFLASAILVNFWRIWYDPT